MFTKKTTFYSKETITVKNGNKSTSTTKEISTDKEPKEFKKFEKIMDKFSKLMDEL